MLKRCAVQKLHDDERLGSLLADFVNRADVRVVESGSGLRLALETVQSLRISGYLVRQELQGHKAVQLDVLGLVHDAHASAAQLLDNAIVRDGLAEHRRNAMAYGFRCQRWRAVGPPNCSSPSGAATRNGRRTRSRVLWKSHGHNIPAACFGFIEALVRNFEQIKGC